MNLDGALPVQQVQNSYAVFADAASSRCTATALSAAVRCSSTGWSGWPRCPPAAGATAQVWNRLIITTGDGHPRRRGHRLVLCAMWIVRC